MHLVAAARTGLLVVGKIILDALARQVLRQRLAATLLALRLLDRRKASVRQVDDLAIFAGGVVFIANLLGFIEETIDVLFAFRRKRCSRASANSSSSLTTRALSASFSAFGAAISAAFTANCAINSATSGSPGRIIRFLNLSRTDASTEDVEGCQPAIWYCRTGWRTIASISTRSASQMKPR